MSDVMLHGVLCMPPELWGSSELEVRQRYSRYLQASRRIEDDAREIETLRAEVERLRSRTVTLPPLPEPTQGLGIHRWAYSDDDMRDYAIAALREAGVEEKT